MLVLSRREGERIVIGNEIHVTVLAIHGNRVRLAFRAPRTVSIVREELIAAVEPEPGQTKDLCVVGTCDT